MKTKVKLLILILFFSLAGKAQYNWKGITPVTPADSVYAVMDLVLDSLNHPYVYGINFISSDHVIDYFNGTNWQECFALSNINGMEIDKNGILWLTDPDSVLSYYNWTLNTLSYPVIDSVIAGHISFSDLAIDVNNSKWILTTKDSAINTLSTYVCKYNGSAWTVFDSTITGIYAIPSLPYSIANNIVATKNDTSIYIVGKAGYIIKYDGLTWTKTDSTNSNLIGGITLYDGEVDSSGNLWISATSNTCNHFLIRFDGNQFNYYYPPTPWSNITMFLNKIVIDKSNCIWIDAIDEGLIKFNGTTWRFYSPYLMEGLYPPNIGIIEVDTTGNIWIGDYAGVASNSLLVFNEDGFQNISGEIFSDFNGNGVKDSNETMLEKEVCYSSLGINSITDESGQFHVAFLDSSVTLNINHQLKKYRYHSTSPTSYTVLPITQSTTGKDFGVAETPNVTDVTVTGYFFPTRPGFNSYGGIDYENIGTTTVSDTITLHLDNNYTFLNSTPSPDITNGNKLQWLFNNLSPLTYGHISLNLYVSASVNIGDTLISSVSINPIIGDTVPGDNTDYISKIVTGSFDPNEKEVEPKGTGTSGNIPNGETLSYTIHFQNTGTDTAFTVSISDTLSTNLDVSSFQFIGSSHPVVTEIKGAGNLKFTFYNILLPDSNTNEPLSQGYVSYRIKATDNLPLGTQIKNTAYIYFDFNAPVVTNTTLNTIANPTGIPFFNNDYSANVFPNPIQDISTLEINGMDLNSKLTLKLYDVLGHEINIAVSKIANNRFAIHRADLVSGLYFYKVSDGSVLISSGKIIIQ